MESFLLCLGVPVLLSAEPTIRTSKFILLDGSCDLLNVDQLLFVDKLRGITLEEEQDWSVKLRNVLIVIPGNALRIPIGKSFLK